MDTRSPVVDQQPVAAAEIGEALAVDKLLHNRRADQGVFLGQLAVDPRPLLRHESLDLFDGRRSRRLGHESSVPFNDDLQGRPIRRRSHGQSQVANLDDVEVVHGDGEP